MLARALAGWLAGWLIVVVSCHVHGLVDTAAAPLYLPVDCGLGGGGEW